MTCEETRKQLSTYLDAIQSAETRTQTEAHLAVCPVCRQELFEMQQTLRALRSVARPVAPPDLTTSIQYALTIERAAQVAHPAETFYARFPRLIENYFLPYAVGAMASLLLVFFMYGVLRAQYIADAEWQRLSAATALQTDANNVQTINDVTKPVPIPPALFAASRQQFATESPSLNPRGALATLVGRNSAGSEGDDDMVIVADVYSDGQASVAEVMQPPRDPQMLREFQQAMRQNAAFVPASLDHRQQTMRVVFVMQKIDVPEKSF